MTLLVSPPPDYRNLSMWVRKSANGFLIIGFLGMLGAMLFGLVRGNASDIEQWERRRAEHFPAIRYKSAGFVQRPDMRSIKLFPRQFEKWFNDRLGFRRPLIQLYQTARNHGWTSSHLSPAAVAAKGHSDAPAAKHGENTSTGEQSAPVAVLVGREGWLYFHHPVCIEEFRGTSLFTEAELKHWKDTLEARRDWLARRGISYAYLVAPNKATIYPEHVPSTLTKVTDQSRLKQLTDYLARESDVTFIDLVKPLRQAKSQYRLYYKTDTHWNQHGAFVGYQALMQPIQKWFPQVRVSTRDDYEVVIHQGEVSNIAQHFHLGVVMDLAVISGATIPYREELFEFVPRRKELEAPRDYGGTHRSERGEEKHQIPKVVVVHDSFMHALSRFLTPHCREVTYIPQPPDGVFPAEDIERIQPVLVIEELVQRQLGTPPPSNPFRMLEE